VDSAALSFAPLTRFFYTKTYLAWKPLLFWVWLLSRLKARWNFYGKNLLPVRMTQTKDMAGGNMWQ